jgi:hypothetical protein
MQIFSRAMLFVLLGAVIVAPLAARGFVTPGGQDGPAGCHEDGKRPIPGPTSHQCCQGGHDFAILLATPGPSLEASALIQFSQVATTPTTLNTLPNPAIVSGDPPSPLRV